MAHRLSPEAEAKLDGIWYYVATGSSSVQVADRLIDTLTKRFYLLALTRILDAAGMRTCGPACGASPWVSTSFFTVSKQEDVLVLHVVRGSRDVDELFGR